ncbi:sterile alpha motif domain-containing protein 10-like isoform X5 [Hyperolius riggenbachi]
MDAAAHFRFCRNLLEHTVSTENLNHRFRREIGNSLTWHDGRGNRTSGGRAIKLLKQPGTDISQAWSTHDASEVTEVWGQHQAETGSEESAWPIYTGDKHTWLTYTGGNCT